MFCNFVDIMKTNVIKIIKHNSSIRDCDDDSQGYKEDKGDKSWVVKIKQGGNIWRNMENMFFRIIDCTVSQLRATYI